MTRPHRLICFIGTRTEVGKTWCATRLLARVRKKGLRVAARKPVQSYENSHMNTDAAELARASLEEERDVCLPFRSYAIALAPPMAADVLRRERILLDDLIAEMRWPDAIDMGIVETVGGPRSPIAHDADSVDLVRRLNPDQVILVVDAGLGALNATRLSLAALEPMETIVYLNRYDANIESHRLNRQWLIERYAVRAVTTVDELLEQLGV